MSNHDGVGITAGLHVITDFERVVKILSRLALLRGRIRNDRHVDRTKTLLVAMDIFLERHNELIHHDGRHHDARHDLLRLLHAEQKIHDEFMLALQHDSARRKNSAREMGWHQRPDRCVTDLLALWAFIV